MLKWRSRNIYFNYQFWTVGHFCEPVARHLFEMGIFSDTKCLYCHFWSILCILASLNFFQKQTTY